MAHFFRLVALGLALLLVNSAHALIPKVADGSLEARRQQTAPANGYGPPAQICIEEIARQYSAFTFTGFRSTQGGNNVACDAKRNSDNQAFNPIINLVARLAPASCPANSTATNSTHCQCNSGFQQNPAATACVPIPSECEALAGKPYGGAKWYAQGAGTGADTHSFCDSFNTAAGGKCSVIASKDVCWAGPDGRTVCSGEGKYTGNQAATCDGTGGDGSSPAPTPNAVDGSGTSPSPCPNGNAGTVNGTTVCVPMDPTAGVDWNSKAEQTNPDGTKVEIEKKTSCAGGQCTTETKTTTKDAQGNITNVSNTTNKEAIGDACKKDAGAKGCTGTGLSGKGGGDFGGSCVEGFKAESDDPVIAAMALEQHKRNCLLFETETEERTAYEADKVKGKAGTDQTANLPGNKSVNVSELNLQGTSLINVSACITDKTFVIVGRSVTLPFSRICDILGYMGTILVAVAYLTAARIVTKG